MKINKIKIGPQDFTIEFRNPDQDGMLSDGTHGYTLDYGNLIVISRNLSPSKQRVVLVHEILHACRMVLEGDMPTKKKDYAAWEHYFIGIYENALLMLIRDNPDLVEWLKDE